MQAGQRILEDHPDLCAADLRQFLPGHREQVPAVEQRLALDIGAAGQAHDRLGGHALPRPGFTHDAEGLPGLYGERDSPDRLDDSVVGPEGDMQVLDLE